MEQKDNTGIMVKELEYSILQLQKSIRPDPSSQRLKYIAFSIFWPLYLSENP